MAFSSMMFIIIAIVSIVVSLSPPVLATEFVIGGDNGWTTGVDYQAWAQEKEFHVGDTLVFNYEQGRHNVLGVDDTSFQQCKAPPEVHPLTTGKDVVTLATTGKKWYICGVPNHCELGKQKLVITVLPKVASPTATPTPPQTPNAPSKAMKVDLSSHFGLMMLFFGILGMTTV